MHSMRVVGDAGKDLAAVLKGTCPLEAPERMKDEEGAQRGRGRHNPTW